MVDVAGEVNYIFIFFILSGKYTKTLQHSVPT